MFESENEEAKKRIKEWVYKNIGTIHTFQGKEAGMVIIALGIGTDDEGNGAISWASQRPNMLNVAVTRAKKLLYIVGDENKWKHQPYFKEAYKQCGGSIKEES